MSNDDSTPDDDIELEGGDVDDLADKLTRVLTASPEEYERMQQLTGGQNAIVITPRRAGGGFKLPGL